MEKNYVLIVKYDYGVLEKYQGDLYVKRFELNDDKTIKRCDYTKDINEAQTFIEYNQEYINIIKKTIKEVSPRAYASIVEMINIEGVKKWKV